MISDCTYQFSCLSHHYEQICIDLPNSEHRMQARNPNTANVHNLINIYDRFALYKWIIDIQNVLF